MNRFNIYGETNFSQNKKISPIEVVIYKITALKETFIAIIYYVIASNVPIEMVI